MFIYERQKPVKFIGRVAALESVFTLADAAAAAAAAAAVFTAGG